MIKLDDVSIVDLYEMSLDSSKVDYTLLNSLNITCYSQLSNLIENGNINNEYLIEYLMKVKRYIRKANDLGRNPEIYKLDNYRCFGYDEETIRLLNRQDHKVVGSDLLYANPLGGVCVTNNILGKMNISRIKYLLGHCVVMDSSYIGSNALANERGFGEHAVNKVLNSIKFYEEQVIRQLKENNDIVCDNLFYNNYDYKVSLVLDKLWEIVRYFVDNANLCIWGNMSDYQKKELLDTLSKNYYNPMERPIISRFVNCIANYTTVSELENNVVKTKVLNRFIVK